MRLSKVAAGVHYGLKLRPYQQQAKNEIYDAWTNGYQNVLYICPTGGGKTVTLASIVHDHVGAACVIAHRQELVGQISKALAREGVYHNIIAPAKTIQQIRNDHVNELGKDFLQPNSQVCVAGVQTLIRRKSNLQHWMRQVSLWIIDECHHVVEGNTWGNAVELFPNAKGLGVTATPIRADGKGLGRHASGVFDTMVQGPTMRWLIDNNYLTDYKIFAPESDINVNAVNINKDGDFNQKQLKKAARESHIVGDVVQSYCKFAMGKRGVTFVTDVETAKDVAAEYCKNGVPAEAVDANTPSDLRAAILRRFAKGELMQLVNVDLFGEGFDLPAIECVSFARPTMSYSLYVQQFGRALRILDGKDYAIIIDHVGNVVRHGLPDKERVWSLDNGDKKPRVLDPDDEIPLQYCASCTRPYEKFIKICPHCGWYEEPEGRSTPAQVDGDLVELPAEILAMMRGEADRIATETPQEVAQRVTDDLVAKHAPRVAILGHSKRAALKHQERQDAQSAIKESIAWWASFQQCSDSESYRKFFHLFGTDVLTAQTLPGDEMIKLANNINDYIAKKVETHV